MAGWSPSRLFSYSRSTYFCCIFFPCDIFQAFDTTTHALIVRDMLSWDERFSGRELGLRSILLVVGAVWAVHAVASLVRVSKMKQPSTPQSKQKSATMSGLTVCCREGRGTAEIRYPSRKLVLYSRSPAHLSPAAGMPSVRPRSSWGVCVCVTMPKKNYDTVLTYLVTYSIYSIYTCTPK